MEGGAVNELRQRLSTIRRTARTSSRQKYFYSPAKVKDLLTHNDICICLSLIPALENNERDIHRYAYLIQETSLIVFAILLSDRNQPHILEFVFRRDTDEKLHYGEDTLYYLPALVRSQFVQRQWEFHPVHFNRGYIPRKIEPSAILPILSETDVGAGSFGTVWKIRLYPSCQSLMPAVVGQDIVVARKELQRGDSGKTERAVLELLQTLKHPNIIKFLGSYSYHGNCSLLFPLADMDLKNLLYDKSCPSMEVHLIYAGIYGIADALSAIHNFESKDKEFSISNIGYHHDLRPANILIDRGVFLIADFGLSRLKPDDQDSKTPLRGGQDDYLAPECFDYEAWTNGSVGRASDVWSLACIIAELATFIEREDVSAFRSKRKATHGVGIHKTDHAFYLNRKVRPAVAQWLDDLVREPKNQQVAGLVRVVRDMMNPNHLRRPRISEVVPRLKLLAINSAFVEIDCLFESASCGINGSPRSDLQVLVLLEHKRVQAWWSVFNLRSLDEISNSTSTILACLGRLHGFLESLGLLQSALIATELPSDFLNEIDSLCKTLPGEASNKVEALWSQAVWEIEDFRILEAIRTASKSQRYRSVEIGAAMRRMSHAISKSIQLGNRSRYMDSGAVKIDEMSPMMLSPGLVLDASKTMGYYLEDGDQGRRVLVEWKSYNAHWKNKTEDLHRLMDSLTNLLDPHVTPRQGVPAYRILDCIGYFHEQRNFRFGFVYNLRNVPDQAQLFSLSNVLRMTPAEQEDAVRPDLGDVFYLAKDLASCLLAVHEVGWLHKNFSSHHVLVFAPGAASVSKYVASAVLSGFNDSRPEASSVTLGPTEVLLYRHPNYVPGIQFRRTFDYFGLGLVLLELGLWLPVSELKSGHPEITNDEEFRVKLLLSYVPQLGEKMGTRYRDAVQFCLDSEDIIMIELGEQGMEDQKIWHQMFQERVVDKLAGCYA